MRAADVVSCHIYLWPSCTCTEHVAILSCPLTPLTVARAVAGMADSQSDTAVSSAHSSRDKAFEIFVKRTITSIQKEAWGRSREVKEIREACQAFLNRLEETGCTEETLKEVLYPLQLACCSNMQRVVELALGCLHKLVAHAWLHGESTSSGSMDLLSATGSVDSDDTVAQVIKMVIRCGETNNDALQLSVVRALLTFTTAEHFVAHGECLLAAVRAVFNLALGSDNAANKRTACNALLQMLNTITKRVTQIQPRHTGSECSSRTASDAHDLMRSTSSIHSYQNNMYSPKTDAHTGFNSGSNVISQLGSFPEAAPADLSAGDVTDGNYRAAQLANLAKQGDLRGLEAALEATAPEELDLEDNSGGSEPDTATPRATAYSVTTPRTSSGGMGNQQGAATAVAAGATADGEDVLTPTVSGSNGRPSGRAGGALPLSQAAVAQQTAQGHQSQRLTTLEKDVLLVLTAFCKLASRESGSSSAESYLHQGKLLALEMLAKVLSNPLHFWDHVREPFCRQLRQPLCMALLRNCANNDPAAFDLAVRLLSSILSLPRLRLGLRAELGAFYPLLILRPLEQEAPEPANLAAALSSIQGVVSDPQLLVDVFVNYDCDLQASNLYERTILVCNQPMVCLASANTAVHDAYVCCTYAAVYCIMLSKLMATSDDYSPALDLQTLAVVLHCQQLGTSCCH